MGYKKIYKKTARKLFESGRDFIIIPNKTRVNNLWNVGCTINSNDKEKLSFNELLNNLLCENNINISLTTRERECLQHIAQRKTYRNVGKLLNISSRTVETHIINAKVRNNIETTSELVEMYYNS